MAERRVDPDSQEKLWEEVKHSKVQIPLIINENGEVNSPPEGESYLKLVLISDTHCQLGDIIQQGLIPDGDVLIHAGDITTTGDEKSLRLFNEQLGSLPHPNKLVIAGNHEIGFDETEQLCDRKEKYKECGTPFGYRLLTNCTFLNDTSVLIDGVKFYGSSWHPLPGYPFYRPRDQLAHKWDNIPEDTDVVITHSPPLGYLDLFPPSEVWGCRHLLDKIEEIQPSLHVFGHVHACYGALSNGKTTFVNASSEMASKQGFNKPVVFYIPKQL